MEDRPYDHKRDADGLLPSQKYGDKNTHALLTPDAIVMLFSTPGLRRNTLTPSAYREKRIAARTWSDADEAEYQAANA